MPYRPMNLSLLAQAAAGLLMPSETNAPFVPFRWPGAAPLTEDALRTTLGVAADIPIATRDVAAVFRPLITTQSWHTAEDTARCKAFQALYAALGRLTDVAVYRIGTVAITTLLIGRDRTGALVGLRTEQVET